MQRSWPHLRQSGGPAVNDAGTRQDHATVRKQQAEGTGKSSLAPHILSAPCANAMSSAQARTALISSGSVGHSGSVTHPLGVSHRDCSRGVQTAICACLQHSTSARSAELRALFSWRPAPCARAALRLRLRKPCVPYPFRSHEHVHAQLLACTTELKSLCACGARNSNTGVCQKLLFLAHRATTHTLRAPAQARQLQDIEDSLQTLNRARSQFAASTPLGVDGSATMGLDALLEDLMYKQAEMEREQMEADLTPHGASTTALLDVSGAFTRRCAPPFS